MKNPFKTSASAHDYGEKKKSINNFILKSTCQLGLSCKVTVHKEIWSGDKCLLFNSGFADDIKTKKVSVYTECYIVKNC